jgi:hypothetical protein
MEAVREDPNIDTEIITDTEDEYTETPDSSRSPQNAEHRRAGYDFHISENQCPDSSRSPQNTENRRAGLISSPPLNTTPVISSTSSNTTPVETNTKKVTFVKEQIFETKYNKNLKIDSEVNLDSENELEDIDEIIDDRKYDNDEVKNKIKNNTDRKDKDEIIEIELEQYKKKPLTVQLLNEHLGIFNSFPVNFNPVVIGIPEPETLNMKTMTIQDIFNVIDGNEDDNNNNDNDNIEDNKDQKSDVDEELHVQDQKPQTKNPEQTTKDKYLFNIGGHLFNLSKDIVSLFHLDIHKLTKIDDPKGYFLDRDPYYFKKIFDLIKKYGIFNSNNFEKDLDSFSVNLIAELCHYGFIDKKYKPDPVIVSKKIVEFNPDHSLNYNYTNALVKLSLENESFTTLYKTLAKSKYFERLLRMQTTPGKVKNLHQFTLRGINPNCFRYVINYLRTGELFVQTDELYELLNKYEIDFVSLEDKNKVIRNVISYAEPINASYLFGQMVSQRIESLDMYNIINTTSKLDFDSDLKFHLKKEDLGSGAYITDLLLVIDLPVTRVNDKFEYVDDIQYKIIQSIDIVNKKKLLLHTNSKALQLYPIIYHKNYREYRSFGNPLEHKKMIFENNLIDLHRITIPLNIVTEQSPLPVFAGNISVNIHIAPLKNIIQVDQSGKLPNNISVLSAHLKAKIKLVNMSLNPIRALTYYYQKLHTLNIDIRKHADAHRNIASISLNKLSVIKEIYFTISEKPKNYLNKLIKNDDLYSDALVEFLVLRKTSDASSSQNHYMTLIQLDPLTMNSYEPLKLLGREMPRGVYYHSFSQNNQNDSGLPGQDNLLVIKTKKIMGNIQLFVVENFKYTYS